MAVVVTEKVVEVLPAATVTDAGAVRVEFVFDNVTVAPPAGAGWVRTTVQVVDELGPKLEALQASEDTNTGATRLTVVLTALPL
jgi:hypothetical protein